MPILTPGATRYTPLALLKGSRFSMVSLVTEVASKEERVARLLTPPANASEVDLLEGLARVARTLKSFSHPGVPRFDQVVEGAGGTWLLFEYVRGYPLSHYYNVESSIPDRWILWWLQQLLRVMEALHSHTPPIVVGYLEPSDVIVRDDRLSVCDLGLFEDVFPEIAARTLSSHPYVNFIAPERRLAPLALPSADLFSVGAIAFWLCTGKAPVVAGPSASPRLLPRLLQDRPQFPMEAARLISELMSFYPSQRPATARDALACLGTVVPDLSGQVAPQARNVSSMLLAAQATKKVPDEPKETRTPPPPVFETLPPERPDDLFAADAVRPPLAPWQEFLEDLTWQLRRHPVAIGVGVCVLGAAFVALLRATTPAPLPPAPLMRVATGQVLRLSVPSGHYQGQWEPVSDIDPGASLSVGDQPASLKFNHSTILLGPDAILSCLGQEENTVAMQVSHGNVRTITGKDDELRVHLISGNLLIVGKNSDVTADLNASGARPRYSIACTHGKATLTIGADNRHLTSGMAITLTPVGQAAP